MDVLVGTPQCPHLGFESREGRPCCRAGDETRRACGKWAPNPKARTGAYEDAWFCAVLGEAALPPEALRLKAKQLKEEREAERPSGYRAPDEVRGTLPARPSREQDFDAAAPGDPVIPTHTLKRERAPVRPNDKCPCGSGKKYKKCCGN